MVYWYCMVSVTTGVGIMIILLLFFIAPLHAGWFDWFLPTAQMPETPAEVFTYMQEQQLMHPDDPVIAYNMGTAQYQLEQYDAAEKHFGYAAQKVNPEHPMYQKIYHNWGNSLGKPLCDIANNPDGYSVEQIKRRIEEATDAFSKYDAVSAVSEYKKSDEARTVLREAIELLTKKLKEREQQQEQSPDNTQDQKDNNSSEQQDNEKCDQCQNKQEGDNGSQGNDQNQAQENFGNEKENSSEQENKSSNDNTQNNESESKSEGEGSESSTGKPSAGQENDSEENAPKKTEETEVPRAEDQKDNPSSDKRPSEEKSTESSEEAGEKNNGHSESSGNEPKEDGSDDSSDSSPAGDSSASDVGNMSEADKVSGDEAIAPGTFDTEENSSQAAPIDIAQTPQQHSGNAYKGLDKSNDMQMRKAYVMLDALEQQEANLQKQLLLEKTSHQQPDKRSYKQW